MNEIIHTLCICIILILSIWIAIIESMSARKRDEYIKKYGTHRLIEKQLDGITYYILEEYTIHKWNIKYIYTDLITAVNDKNACNKIYLSTKGTETLKRDLSKIEGNII